MLFLDRSGTFRSICPDMVAKRLRRKVPACLKNSKENYIMRLTKRYLSSLFFSLRATRPHRSALIYKPRTYQSKTVRGTHYPSRSQVMGDQPSTRTPTESISTTVSLLELTTHKFAVPPLLRCRGWYGSRKELPLQILNRIYPICLNL